MASAPDDRTRLAALRTGAGLTQAEMAKALGMSLRAYGSLENGHAAVRRVHMLATERITLRLAAERGDASVLAGPVRTDIAAVMRPVKDDVAEALRLLTPEG